MTTQPDTSTVNSVLVAALEFRAAGISVVPVRNDGTKAPAGSWKEFQSRLADGPEIVNWLSNADGFGIVTGAISGGLEMLELEGRAVAAGLLEEARDIAEASGLDAVWDKLSETYIERTPSGGIHWLYRIEDAPVPGNTKIARRPGENGGVDVLIETRGEGGFVVVAPSGGNTHPSGHSWERLNNSTPSSIVKFTIEERNDLHDLFRALDQMPDVETLTASVAPIRDGDTLMPGDDYNQRASWDDILIPLGWKKLYRMPNGEWRWRRPDKDVGVSASTGRNAGDNLWVFTTSTTFAQEKVYSKFAAHAHLYFNDDFVAAAKDLRRLGYGSPSLVTDNVTALGTFTPDFADSQDLGFELDPAAQRRASLFAYELESQSIRRDVKKHLDDAHIVATFSRPIYMPTLTEELQQPDTDPEWAISDLIPKGANVLLTAAFKSGKTTLVNNLVRSLADQTDFLGEYGIEDHQGQIVIFNYEVDERQYRRWMRDLNIQNPDRVTLVNLRGKRLPVTTSHIEDYVVETLHGLNCETWIVDPFARAFTGSGDENSNSDVGVFLDTLDVIKARAGVSNLILPVHTGRNQEQGVERARGATRIDDWADVRWLLNKNVDGVRFFSATGRDVEVAEMTLAWDEATRSVTVGSRSDAKAHKVHALVESIVTYVTNNPGAKSDDLERAVGGNSKDFRRARDEAEKTFRIRYQEAGRAKFWYPNQLRPLHLEPASEVS